MTDREIEVMKASAHLWNEFLKLPVVHPDDNNEFRFHIHAIQNMILARNGVPALGINKKDIVAK